MARKWNDKFKYQLTHYMPEANIHSFVQPFINDHCVEGLHYVIKRHGTKDEVAIYTMGNELNKDYKDICRREIGK